MNANSTLLYVHDPMCSWCYGFKPVLNLLTERLKDKLKIKYLLGGLAADTDKPMSIDMQKQIKMNWSRIEQSIPGTQFNYDFWDQNTPKRSTYPSCRAVIAAKKQSIYNESLMIDAIQNAYYLTAQDPSSYQVLNTLAKEIKLDINQFEFDLHSDKINNELLQQISLCRKIGADSFPSLYIIKNETYHPIVLDYNNADIILEHIKDFF